MSGGGAAWRLQWSREVAHWVEGDPTPGIGVCGWPSGWEGAGLAPSGRGEPQGGWAACLPGKRWRREPRGGLSPPSLLQARRSGARCARVFIRPVGRGAGGRVLPEGGLGGSGAAARAEKLRPRGAEPRGASACYSSAPESCGGWRQGRQERFGLGRRTSCQAVKLSESDEGWWW